MLRYRGRTVLRGTTGGGGAPPAAPSVITPPSQTGNFFVGQTLTRVAGSYSGSPTPTVTWIWQKNGVDIGGTANAATYVIQAGDDGATITVKDTATNTSGSVDSSSAGIIGIQAALWLDAADTSSISQVSGSVSQWADKSGNGRHAVQATGANQPITGTRSQNGLNTIAFSSGKLLVSSGFSLAQPNMIFSVAKFDVSNKGYAFDGGGSTTRNALFIDGGTSKWVTFAGGGFSSSIADTNPNIHANIFNGASSAHYINGVSAGTGNAGTANLGGMTIGSRYTGGTDSLDGFAAEYAVINRSLTTAEKNQIGNYLSVKWGIAWTNL